MNFRKSRRIYECVAYKEAKLKDDYLYYKKRAEESPDDYDLYERVQEIDKERAELLEIMDDFDNGSVFPVVRRAE